MDDSQPNTPRKDPSYDDTKFNWRGILTDIAPLAILMIVIMGRAGYADWQDRSHTVSELFHRISSGEIRKTIYSKNYSNSLRVELVPEKDSKEFKSNDYVVPFALEEQLISVAQQSNVPLIYDPARLDSVVLIVAIVLFALLAWAYVVLMVLRGVSSLLSIVSGKEFGLSDFMPKWWGSSTGSKIPGVKFENVATVGPAKEKLRTAVQFLKEETNITKLGGKMPKGILLSGPPGTGKTMLAKAVAGEAGIPFYAVSGSDFVEMYIGSGAMKVRELFKAARKQKQAIVFIDELDAIGGKRRDADHGAGGSERRSTLNQILVELDGFHEAPGLLVLAATNFIEDLDPALTRPGRFDYIVEVPLPDIEERLEILKALSGASKIVFASDVNLRVIAAATSGFSGAQLGNLLNRSTVVAVNHHCDEVSQVHLEMAWDEIVAGESGSTILFEDVRHSTAAHEAGHAVVAYVLNSQESDIHSVSIKQLRGRSLGRVVRIPRREEGNLTRNLLIDELAILYGGRAGEIAVAVPGSSADVTTGASDDLRRASELASQMVMEWGMGSSVGVRSVHSKGFDGDVPEFVSDETRQRIDRDIEEITREAFERAKRILAENRDFFAAFRTALTERDFLRKSDLDSIAESVGRRAPTADLPHPIKFRLSNDPIRRSPNSSRRRVGMSL